MPPRAPIAFLTPARVYFHANMKEHNTFPGKTYVVTSKVGCTITDASGELDETCEPGKQKAISAPSDKLYTSEHAVVRETFNGAPAVGSGGGAGVSEDDGIDTQLKAALMASLSEVDLNCAIIDNKINESVVSVKFPEAWFSDTVLFYLCYKKELIDNGTKFWSYYKNKFGNSDAIRHIVLYGKNAVTHSSALHNGYCPNLETYDVYCDGGYWRGEGYALNMGSMTRIRYICPRIKILPIEMWSNYTVKVIHLEAKSVPTHYRDVHFPFKVKGNVVRNLQLSAQTDASYLFYSLDAALLVAKYADGFWEKIVKAVDAFYNCQNLSNSQFPTALPALTDGTGMFSNCKLSKEVAISILNSLQTASSVTTNNTWCITMGIHIDHQTDEEVITAITAAEEKGWTVTVQWNGTATAAAASTYSLRRAAVQARVVEIVDEDGHVGKFLEWGHYVTNAEENDYTEFASLEEAKEHFNIID